MEHCLSEDSYRRFAAYLQEPTRRGRWRVSRGGLQARRALAQFRIPPLGNSSLSRGTISSGGDGSDIAPSPPSPATPRCSVCRSGRSRRMAVESSRMPATSKIPDADTGRTRWRNSDTLTCEQERGLRMEPSRGRPATEEDDDGQKEGASRSGTSSSRWSKRHAT